MAVLGQRDKMLYMRTDGFSAPRGGEVQKVIDLRHLGSAVGPAQVLLQLHVGVGVCGIVVHHILHRGHRLRRQLAHAEVVLCNGESDLAYRECRLTHVEPGGRPIQPKPRQAQARADCRKHELVTWNAGITLVPGGGSGALPWEEVEGGRVQGLEQGHRLGGLGLSTASGSVRQSYDDDGYWFSKNPFV